jgi:uncharacterized protein YidB (DUF937 family)
MSEFLGQLPALLSELLGAAEGATAGALPVVLAQLENAGLGDKVRSWLGHGENETISPDQIAAAISADQRTAWAKEAGISVEQLNQVLAHILPELTSKQAKAGAINPKPQADA